MAKQEKGKNLFEKFAEKVTKATGSTPVFLSAFLIVVVWAVCGPIFDYSETWQLVINTGTTIITFLMVFLIQKTQNKDSLAIQIKLNELLASHELASNRIVDIEDISEDELEVLEQYYRKLAELTKKQKTLKESHSISEAQARHELKSVENQKSKVKSQKSGASKPQASKASEQASKSKPQNTGTKIPAKPKTPNSKTK